MGRGRGDGGGGTQLKMLLHFSVTSHFLLMQVFPNFKPKTLKMHLKTTELQGC
jgi:hypothetical protein